MKKVLAILLAALLMTMAAALAEGNAVRIADPIVSLLTEDGQTYDLTGLDVTIAGGMIGDMPAAKLTVNDNGEALISADINIVGDLCVFAIDGVDGVYAYQIPAEVLNVQNFDASQLNIDIERIGEILQSSIEMDGDTIRIPYTAVNDLLEELAPSFAAMEIPGFDASQLPELVQQLKESDTGITLEGTYQQTEDGAGIVAEAILVQGGETASSLCTLSGSYSAGGVAVAVEVQDQFSGAVTVNVTEDGEYEIGLSAMAQGMGAAASFTVSQVETEDAFVELDASAAVDVQSMDEEAMEAFSTQLQGALGNVILFVSDALMAAA